MVGTRLKTVCGEFQPEIHGPQNFDGHLRIDKEGDPADDDEEGGGEVVGDHVEGHLPRQHQLKSSNAEVQQVFHSLFRESAKVDMMC